MAIGACPIDTYTYVSITFEELESFGGNTNSFPGGFGERAGARNGKWWALVFLALAQFMVVLDGTIVNLALPRLQAEMGISDSTRAWVVTAYALALGAFLLLGGRIADFWGRKRAFMTAATGFAVASLLGGLAQAPWELIGARALQGLFAALLAPAALALLTVSFPGGQERGTAFAVFGSISGVGAAVGVLLGGFLTDYVSWRWCFFVNVPIAVVALLGVWKRVTESKAGGVPRSTTGPAWSWRPWALAPWSTASPTPNTAGPPPERGASSWPVPCCMVLFVVVEKRVASTPCFRCAWPPNATGRQPSWRPSWPVPS